MHLRFLHRLTSRAKAQEPRRSEALELIDQVRFDVRPVLSGRPALNVLLPSLSVSRMTGGPNTVLQLTARAAQKGVRIRYLSCLGPPEREKSLLYRHLKSIIGESLLERNIEFCGIDPRESPFEIGGYDGFCATFWPTAYVAERAMEKIRRNRFLYVIQDYEPAFYPWSTEFSSALQTYSMNFQAVVNEGLLLEFFRTHRIGRFSKSEFIRETVTFEPAVDRTKFFPEPARNKIPSKLLFYARPSRPRNLFAIGLDALRIAIKAGAFSDKRWRFVSMGERIADLNLGRNATLRNQTWKSYEDYAASMRETDILLSLMLSPHTSYPPLEGAVCGAKVVTNTFDVKTKEKLSGLSANIVAADAKPESVAEALGEAARAYKEGTADVTGEIAIPRNWDDALGDAIEAVLGYWESFR